MVGTTTAGWPVRSARTEPVAAVVDGPVAGEGPLSGPRWMLVWNRDSLGECCCWRGTVRRDVQGMSVAQQGSCQRPGKHPWSVRVDGEGFGFVHGAADAIEYETLADLYGPPGGARQLAVVLDDLMVVDLDGPRALRDFARLAYTIPREKILGVSSTPRGFHVWLDVPGWTQKALNRWMTDWLAGYGLGWDGTDAAKAGRRGLLLDVRTGVNRYVVWPGGDPARRWLAVGDFARTISGLRAEMLDRTLVGGPDAGKAPWLVDTADPWMAGWIEEHRGGAGDISLEGLSFTGEDAELEVTWAEMERWLARLESMAAGSGRNNALNQIAYFSGARCVAAGHPVEVVRARLIEVGEAVGTHGVGATVDSGLGAGLASLRAQQKKAGV